MNTKETVSKSGLFDRVRAEHGILHHKCEAHTLSIRGTNI